jgi:hypothetical protein
VHLVPFNNPIVPLRPGDRRTEPDLLVGWLLVKNIGSDAGDGNIEDASLVISPVSVYSGYLVWPSRRTRDKEGKTNAILSFNIVSILLDFFDLR